MMKAATIVSSLLGAAAVAVASPVAARAVPDHFTVTGFKASCAANGAPGCSFEFSVSADNGPATTCQYTDASASTNLPSTNPYRACADEAFEWQFRPIDLAGGGVAVAKLLTLTYAEAPAKYGAGFVWEPQERAFEYVDGGETYVGNPDFTVRVG